ncbi:hypothetical protein [Kordia sp.]|uniref:hypothetical protein n=1 Tax=Kordia sp. TaxID=1965332 RepID=UPI003D6A9F30
MEIYCQRCNPRETFKIPDFSFEEKKKLQKLNADSPLQAINAIRTLHAISLKDAKFVISHINPKYKVCHRCQKSLNEDEYTTCPNCRSLNFNWNLNS